MVRIDMALQAGLAGGVGMSVAAVVLAVLCRRWRSGAEIRSFRRGFGAAAGQLGSSDAAVRLAGVYALVNLADEMSAFDRRQQCIDVLCGYLRLPVARDPHDRAADEVRRTILDALAERLQAGAQLSWSRHSFDFRRAQFIDVDFAGAIFAGHSVAFDDAVFLGGYCGFAKSRFTGETVSFTGTRFESGTTSFGAAVFAADRHAFDRAIFSGRTTMFGGAAFRSGQVSFASASFLAQSSTSFIGAVFSGADVSFSRALFASNKTAFDMAEFGEGGRVTFLGASFVGDRTSFAWPRKWANVSVDWARQAALMPASVRPRRWPPLPANHAPAATSTR